MELFDYLMAKKGHNTGGDLFSYLLGKNAGGSGTYTTFSGTSLNISNTIKAKIKNFILNSTELTQDGTPTPDNPVDVNVIKGENNIKITDGIEEQNYPISLSSKNLLNVPSTFTFKATYLIDMKLEAGNYTLSWSSVFTDSTNIRANVLMKYEDGTFSGNNFVDFTSTNRSLSPSKKVKRIYFYSDVGAASSDNITITYENLMLEQGSTVSEYEPYHEPIEYCKIGDYADQIFKNTTDSPYYDNTLVEGDWYIKKNIGKVTFNGAESWELYTDNVFSYEKITNIRNCLSDYYVFNSTERIGQLLDGQFGIANSANSNRICFKNENCSTVTDFKTWLSTHNTEVYYPLAIPTYIHISQTEYPTLKAQLDNLYNNAKSYNGQTNITQTNEDLPFNISVDVKVKTE